MSHELRYRSSGLNSAEGAAAMIDRHYGALARNGGEHPLNLLDELNAPEFVPWTLVEAAWTSKPHGSVDANRRAELAS